MQKLSPQMLTYENYGNQELAWAAWRKGALFWIQPTDKKVYPFIAY